MALVDPDWEDHLHRLLAASAMQPGSVIIADDVRSHEGFATFARRHPDYEAVIAESADAVEFFGIAVNVARPAAASS
jgi:hypothetical protein